MKQEEIRRYIEEMLDVADMRVLRMNGMFFVCCFSLRG